MADIDISMGKGAAQVCNQCGSRIYRDTLDAAVASLRELDASHFNLCRDCISIADNECTRCGGGVYIPRSQQDTDCQPSLCPACRNDIIQSSGYDPGWSLND